MAVREYEEYQTGSKGLHAILCIYQKPGYGGASPVNHMLEEIQLSLHRECREGRRIRIAFVFENPSYLDARAFEDIDEGTPVFYKEVNDHLEVHSVAHVLFMGLAMLEQLRDAADSENRLYLITDEKFDRVQSNQVVYRSGDGSVKLHPRFGGLEIHPILYKTEQAGGGVLEEFFGEDKYIFTVG